mmetsp:Transcript_22868/g.27063  ORF Transcript_22868/g.27063 Transcript_22868/m.27063 type:complete len:157 (-) Transcript_22868:467-937(-)
MTTDVKLLSQYLRRNAHPNLVFLMGGGVSESLRITGGVTISLEFDSEYKGTPSRHRPIEFRLWSDWFRRRLFGRSKLELSSLDDLLLPLHDLILIRDRDVLSFGKYNIPSKEAFETEFSRMTSMLLNDVCLHNLSFLEDSRSASDVDPDSGTMFSL